MKRILSYSIALSAILLAVSLLSCHQEDEDERTRQCAESFTNAYFNFKYTTACQYVTPESRKWVSFIASNLSQKDLDVINSQEDTSSCDVSEIEMINDTLATASISVSNCYVTQAMDSGSVAKEVNIQLELHKRDNKWLVHLTSLPQATHKDRQEASR